MNSITFSDKHPPCGYLGILGCNGYEKSESVVCLTANGDNNFLNEGIVRVFELLNLNRINNNRAEEMLLCIYRLLYPNRKLDDGIFNDEIDQYFSYREWKKSHKKLDQVTVSDILLTEGINQAALLRIFDGVTAAFYKSSEYDSRRYRYSDLKELLKYRNNEGKENGNGKTK